MTTASKLPAPALSPRTADLVGRLMGTLDSARGKPVSADAVFEVLKMEATEWAADHTLSPEPATDPLLDSILADARKDEAR